MVKEKIFVIGANKTGTTSMTKALNILGYNLCPEDIMFTKNSKYLTEALKNNYTPLFELVKKYDAFEDRPWNHTDFYKTLNEKFPSLKFIMTIRDTKNWIDSYLRWNKKIKLRDHWIYPLVSKVCYGNEDFLSDLENMEKKYEDRNKEIIEYFKDSNNLLIIDLEKNEGWEKLCNFLNIKVPNKEFPHENKTK